MAGFTFEDVESAWLGEKTSRGLTDLPEEFYANVASYVAELKREVEHGDELRRDLLQSELGEVLRMVQEVHLIRVLKAMDEAVEGKFPDPLLERERYTFDEVRQGLEKLHAELVAPAMEGKTTLTAPREITNMMLLIQAEMPQIVGDDLKSYGPFEVGEVVNLPRRSGELLVKRGMARKISVKKP